MMLQSSSLTMTLIIEDRPHFLEASIIIVNYNIGNVPLEKIALPFFIRSNHIPNDKFYSFAGMCQGNCDRI